jgi:transcriptional regulator with XRE-family HTH domain
VLVGPTIRRRRLGTDLRRLREAKALKLEDVAGHLGVAPSTLSRIETGKAPTRTSYLSIMLDLYGVTDPAQRRALADLALEGQRRGWWTDNDELLPAGAGTYLGLEAEARALRAFGTQVVHDLLQTEDYARAVIAASRPELAAEQADRLLAVQLRRQEVLCGGDSITLRLVLDESVLLRLVGSPEVMRGQLEHLIDAGARPTVMVQVLPLASAPRQVLAGPFGILSFDDPGDGEVACGEGIRGQVLIEERDTEIQSLRLAFDALSLSAMSPTASASLMRELAEAL